MAGPEEVRFCLRCGHAVEPREAFGRVRPVCPSCGRVHFFDPKVAVGVFIEAGGRVLLVRRVNTPEQGKWSFPAGFVDAGEDPAVAAARECLEETGLQVRITGLLDVVSRGSDTEGADILIVFGAAVIGGQPIPADDADRVEFFAPDEVLALDLAFASTRQLIERWRQTRPGAR